MAGEWFYEYEGKKIGPVPGATLRHLATHGAILPQTNVWKADMDTPVSASRVKNLFAKIVNAPAMREASSEEAARKYLCTALEAWRNEDEDRLTHHAPPIYVVHPLSVSSILLEYEIVSVRQLPAPIQDSSTPRDERTKPVRLMFEAAVHVVLCNRPNYRASLDEIRRLQPGRRENTIVFECKEFEDGEWVFLDAQLSG